MDFTREPIIETVITPREGYRLVVRNSKVMGQEEHFVDSIEVVSFGGAFFFRSIERPKPFLVPVGDYEVLEVRESRIVLKAPHAQEGSIKIGAPRDSQRENQRDYQRSPRFQESAQGSVEDAKAPAETRSPSVQQDASKMESRQSDTKQAEGRQAEGRQGEGRQDKRRDRRKPFRRRRGQYREEVREPVASGMYDEAGQQEVSAASTEEATLPEEVAVVGTRGASLTHEAAAPAVRTVIPPPTTLIRDDLQRLRDSEIYGGAFFLRDEKEEDDDDTSLESFAADGSPNEPEPGAPSMPRNAMQEDPGQRGITKESSPEESFLFEQAIEEDIDRDVEDPLSR